MDPARPILERALELGVTGIDTAYNYGSFASHRVLARVAGKLLERFEVSTKVGYFPGGHDLSPARLRAAVAESAALLGRAPDTVFVHNPEHDPSGLAGACEALAECRQEGLCRAWGIATWDPRPLLPVAHLVRERPDVLMVRAGLAVPSHVLNAAEHLAAELGSVELWGMAPFAGNPTDPVWSKVDATVFLEAGQLASPVQARLAAAFALPAVARIAVGTARPDHLAELAAAVRYTVSPAVIEEYRALLAAKAGHEKESAHAADHG